MKTAVPASLTSVSCTSSSPTPARSFAAAFHVRYSENKSNSHEALEPIGGGAGTQRRPGGATEAPAAIKLSRLTNEFNILKSKQLDWPMHGALPAKILD